MGPLLKTNGPEKGTLFTIFQIVPGIIPISASFALRSSDLHETNSAWRFGGKTDKAIKLLLI
jgi:hypothetical protein